MSNMLFNSLGKMRDDINFLYKHVETPRLQ